MTNSDPNFRKSVIAIMSAKGGVGKSTSTWNLGSYYHIALKKNVLILDVEKIPGLSEIPYQGTKIEGKRFDVKHYFDADALLDDIEMFKMRYDIILLDTAGLDVDINSGADSIAQEAMNESAITAADFVLVPCKPSILDAKKTVKFGNVLKKWLKARRNAFQTMCFLNEGRPNENLTKNVHQKLVDNLTIGFFPEGMISYSPRLGEAMANHVSIFDYEPDHFTAEQFNRLSEEVMRRTQAHLASMES